MDRQNKYDLVIVGFGLVGTMAALLAVEHQLRVAIVEKRGLNDLLVAKAGRLDAEVMRIFEQLGLHKELEDILQPLEGTQIQDQKGNVLFELRHAKYEGCAPMYGFFQPKLQQRLQQILISRAGKKLTLFCGYSAEAIEQQPHEVALHLNELNGNHFSQIKTRFLIACNGRDSLVPAQVNLSYRYYGKTYHTMNVDTVTQKPLEQSYFARTICDSTFPVTCITDSDNHQRWEFRLEDEQLKAVETSSQIRILMESLIQQDFEINSAYSYPFETKLLDKWQSKRIFITGDAAHVLPPYLGLSLSAGIKDVHNIIWKIAMVADHQITGHVLDYYQGERERNVKDLLKLNLWIDRMFEARWFRWIRYLLPIIPRFLLRRRLRIFAKVPVGMIGSKSNQRGLFFVHAQLENFKGQRLYIDELLKSRFMILGMNEDPVDAITPSEIEYVAKIRAQFVKVIPAKQPLLRVPRYAEQLKDSSGRIEQWCLKNKAKYIILRPDGILYDAVANEQQLKKAIRLMSRKMPLRRYK